MLILKYFGKAPVGSWQTSTFCHVQLSGRKHRPNPGLVMALERRIPKPSGSWPHTWSLGHQEVGWPPELVEWPPALYTLCVCVSCVNTSSTAQGGGGSFKNRKPIGEVGCCESEMAERSHWWTERCLRSPLFLSLSLTIYLPTSLSSMYLSIDLSLPFSLSSHYLSTYLPIYLSTYLSVYLSIYIYRSIYLSIDLSTYLCIYLSMYLSISPCIYLSVCLSVCLPVYLWCSVIQSNVV